jgi:recombination protein RecT
MAAGTDLVERTPVQEVVARVRSDQFKQQVALALPSSVRPERFQRAVVTAILQNPEVVVDPDSLFNSAIQCAQDGLIPDGREAAFVVFKVKGEKKVQYMPMIGGLRKIAAEHDLTVEAYVVYENDTFEWELGFSPTVTHKPPKLNERAARRSARTRSRPTATPARSSSR